MDCVFCKTIGKLKETRIYENDCWVSFLDLNPIKEGHALLAPKRHVERIQDISREEQMSLGEAMHKTIATLTKAYGEGINIYCTSGKGTSTSVPHLHLHLIPRKFGDRLWEEGKDRSKIALDRSSGFPRLKVSEEELKGVAEKIRSSR